jgi:hypothetical protein
MPRVYRTFEEFERDELNGVSEELDIDEMLDEMFSDDLDTNFKGKDHKGSPAAG